MLIFFKLTLRTERFYKTQFSKIKSDLHFLKPLVEKCGLKIILVFLCVLGSQLFFFSWVYAEKPQTWIDVEIPITKFRGFEFSFYQQYRFEISNFKLLDNRYSLYVKKKLLEYVDAEVHYTLIYSTRPDEILFKQSRRIEIEINPHFNFNKNIKLRLRNRYEFLKREDHPKYIQKFRQKLQFIWKKNKKTLKSLSLHNEVFYNVDLNMVDEYRFVPLEIGLVIQANYQFHIYNLFRWRKQKHTWNSQYIFGISIKL